MCGALITVGQPMPSTATLRGIFFATSGLCSHENVHLCDGLVLGDHIECPKHNGRFNYKTGAAQRAPVTVNLKTYSTRVLNGTVEIEVP